MSIYLDASVLVALLGDEDGTSMAIALVNTATESLVVSDFAKGEVSSAISRAVRTGKIDAETGRDRLDAFDEWVAAATQPIPTEPGDIRLAVQLVRHFALSLKLPDAVHLAAVQIRDMKLATFDERLAVAAEQLRVELVER